MFNDLVPQVQERLPSIGVEQIIHIAGPFQTLPSYQIRSHVTHFSDQMHLLYRASDGVLARAGASTLAELITYEMPSCLVPYPFAVQGHQELNARYMQETIQGGRCILQAELTPQRLLFELEKLFQRSSFYRDSLRDYRLFPRRTSMCTLIDAYFEEDHSTEMNI
jgi:UDP-N-acetylglucosamine--N-acetylmuramyl-(pentapeptide) pyrophosphoryl-undecaprenol N-acetylglucosamine transferase